MGITMGPDVELDKETGLVKPDSKTMTMSQYKKALKARKRALAKKRPPSFEQPGNGMRQEAAE